MKIHFRRWLWLPLVSVPLGIAFTIFPRLAHAQSTSPNIATYAFSSVGLIRGQAMRVSVAGHGGLPPGPCRVFLLNNAGDVVADSGEFLLPAVQNIAIDFDREKIRGNGEGVRGRIQVRPVVRLRSAGQFPPDPIRTGVEVVRTSTGGTVFFEPPPDPDFTTVSTNG